MSRGKAAPKFLKKKTIDSDKRKGISARIPESLYNAFQKASEVAEKNDSVLVLTEVIEVAIQEAIKEVEKEFGVDCYQAELDLDGKASKQNAGNASA